MSEVSSAIYDYAQALDYLRRRTDYERIPIPASAKSEFRLDRTSSLLAELGDPHLIWPAVHVAGTKGKGSTANMIAAILGAAGLRVGLYTSPHLSKLEERFVVDGRPCSEAEAVDLVRRVAIAESTARDADGTPLQATFFEATTAMAMTHFADRRVDVAILEVGLGGRLDSTNVCRPAACAITSIGFDHMKQLGYDLASIAREKAGILKPGVPAVSGAAAAEARAAIREIASERRAPLREIDRDFGVVRESIDRRTFDYFDYFDAAAFTVEEIDVATFALEEIEVALPGSHQRRNAAVAIATVRSLRETFPAVDERAIRRGLATATCRARIERALERPLTYVDAAHTVESVAALLDTLDEELRGRRAIAIFAASRDKPWEAMLDLLAPRFATVILTRYVENPRAVDPGEMAEHLAAGAGSDVDPTRVVVAESPAEAWRKYLDLADDRSIGCVVGSFFLAAEILPLISRS